MPASPINYDKCTTIAPDQNVTVGVSLQIPQPSPSPLQATI
jgi:hypothetical protein